MSTEISCLCGEVKVALEGEALGQFYCHCDDCQATSGAAYLPIALYPSEAVKVVAGEPVSWTYKTNPRSRCPNCGTVVFSSPASFPVKGVRASLLPKGAFKPSAHIQCQDALLPVADNLPHFKAFPAAFGGSDELVDW